MLHHCADHGVTSVMKFHDALHRICNDPRYQALKTSGEKKQVFAEYVSQRAKVEKEEAREARRKAEDNFQKMLAGKV